MRKTKKHFSTPKLIVISKLPELSNHFRMITNNKTAMIYDIKIGKEAIIKYNKEANLVSQASLEKFLFFFNYPGAMNFRQYSNWLDLIIKCTYR